MPRASMQTNSPVIEAPMLTKHVNPSRVHDVSHTLNSSLSVTNNNEGTINLKAPPACYETVPPIDAGLLSPFQVLSAATIGMTKKG